MKTKKYIRDRKGQLVGVLVAAENQDNYAIGFSLCAKSRGDRFDKDLGTSIAHRRALMLLEEGFSKEIPQSIENDFNKFSEECIRYYKGDKEEILFL